MKAGESDRESALDEFRSAVQAFSDDPCRPNLVRYLDASGALERTGSLAVSKRRLAGEVDRQASNCHVTYRTIEAKTM
jgi:hypothetical protein